MVGVPGVESLGRFEEVLATVVVGLTKSAVTGVSSRARLMRIVEGGIGAARGVSKAAGPGGLGCRVWFEVDIV